jgi:hypothetical protein
MTSVAKSGSGERGVAVPTPYGFLEFANGILSFANDGKYVCV